VGFTREGFSFVPSRGTPMPMKPKRPCSYPGCPALTAGRYCEKHGKEMDVRYNKYERDPEANKRYGTHWRKVRFRYITAHPICEECLKNNKLIPALEVHHIIPLSKGGTHDNENLLSLCKSCHSIVSARTGQRWG